MFNISLGTLRGAVCLMALGTCSALEIKMKGLILSSIHMYNKDSTFGYIGGSGGEQ